MKVKRPILFLTRNLNPTDGWARYSLEIVQEFKQRTNATVFAGIPSLFTVPLLWWRLKRQLLPHCAIHVLVEPLIPLGLFLASKKHPLIITVHGTYALTLTRGPRGFFYRLGLKRAREIIAVSHFTKERLLERLPHLAPKIKVIPLGTHRYLPWEEVQPREKRDNQFLMVGEIKARKGMREAIAAFAQIAQKNAQSRLVIVGKILPTTLYQQNLEKLIIDLKLQDKVQFLGQVDERELHQLYQNSLCLLAPSLNVGEHFEGFGLIHLEANSFGLPSLGSLGCGNEDAVCDGRSGLLIEQKNEEALAQKMELFLREDFPWQQFSREAYAWAQEHAWKKCADRHETILLRP